MIESNVYKVENLSDQPLILGWHSRFTTIKPKSIGFAPCDAVHAVYGDPRSGLDRQVIRENGEIQIVPARVEEIKRLGIRYAAGSAWHETSNGKEYISKSDPDAALIRNSPTFIEVDVTTLEGDKVILPVYDPECKSLSPTEHNIDDAEMMRRELEQMRRRTAALEQMIKGKNIPTPSSSIKEDRPSANRAAGPAA